MITAVICTNRAISKSFTQYLSNIPGMHKTKEVQKTAILGTANLLWKELMKKYKISNKAYKIISTINCNYRIATTLYTLKSWFVSGV